MGSYFDITITDPRFSRSDPPDPVPELGRGDPISERIPERGGTRKTGLVKFPLFRAGPLGDLTGRAS
jgi:hypothetical protein